MNPFYWSLSFWVSFYHAFFCLSKVVTSALSFFLPPSHTLIREACLRGAELWCWSCPCGSGAWSPSAAGVPPGGQWAPPQCDLAARWGGSLRKPDHPALAQRISSHLSLFLGWPGSSGCGGRIQLLKYQLDRSPDQSGSHPASRQWV